MLRTILQRASVPRATATMSTIHNTNQACCSIPPVHSDYQPKGSMKSVGSFKRVYVTGDKSASALVCVYDIFGLVDDVPFPACKMLTLPAEQVSQQGADLLASALQTTVYMPDFFEPHHAYPIDRFPPKSQEDKDELQKFFGSVASPPENVKKLVSFGQALRSEGIQKLGVYGMCWGGKVTVVASGENTPFNAAAIVHPAMLSLDDTRKLNAPFAIYISRDEPLDEYNKIVDLLSKNAFADKNDHKNYSNMFHGWAAARADLKNKENQNEFGDVYGRLADFFKKNLA